MKKNREAILEIASQKLKEANSNLNRESRVGHLSLSEIAEIYSKSDDKTFLYAVELLIDDARWQTYFTQGENLNFYDLIPKAVENRYPEHFKQVRKNIESRLKYFDIEKEKNIHSQPNEINSLIDARDDIFNAMKSQEGSKIIDLRNLSHLAYTGTRSMLAYSRTINSPDYTAMKECDDLFKESVKNGFFNSQKPLNAIFLYTGAGYLENAWADTLGIKNKIFIDNSGINLHYLFSNETAEHSKEFVSLDNFYESMTKNKRDSFENIIIKNNAIQNSELQEVMEEMELLGLLSKDFKIFYTVPLFNNYSNSYSDLNNAQMQNFKKELLLTDTSELRRIVDMDEKKYGMMYNIGLQVDKDMVLFNQYFNDSIKLRAGTKIYRFQTWQYNADTLKDMAELGRLKIDSYSNIPGRASLHN